MITFIARAYKFVRFTDIEDHFRLGWMISIPAAPSHHEHYGVVMRWICPCAIPDGRRGVML
jgi:hypothetical protein